jgi:hypothetical protein
MVMTFAGAPLAPCGAIARPQRHQQDARVKRATKTPTPGSWFCICCEWLRLPKALPWNLWQGMSSSAYSEVAAFRQPLLLWPSLPDDPHDVIRRLPAPAVVLKMVELLLCDQRITPEEARAFETALLEHVDGQGQWVP